MLPSTKRWVLGINASILIIAILFLTLTLFSSRQKVSEEESITMGVILSLTGPGAFVGEELRDGLLLAVKELTEGDGISGKSIQLLIEDSQTDPKMGISAFNKLELTDHPDFYISTLSSVSMTLAPLAQQYKVPLIGLVVSAPKFTQQNDWVFRYYPTAKDEVPPILSHLTKLNVKTLGILYLNDDYGVSVFDLLSAEFKKNGGSVKSDSFGVKDSDFRTQLLKLQGMDALYIVGLDSHLKLAYKQLRELGYDGYVLGPSTATLPTVTKTPEAEGVYVAAPRLYDPTFIPARELKIKYQEKYGKPLTHYAANGYDFMKLLGQQLNQQENISRNKIKETLASAFTYSGVFGVINNDIQVHEMSFPLYPARIEKGSIVYDKSSF
ncbi:ABC transporter substrate-binding protein [Candidatus Woesearchaeota archaeon]|nr:ABC transporter substrate-binding protein [Candidatus Woesearchaeota archaeon]